MVQDINKLVVFGSQLVGVLIVIVGMWTQQSNLQSPRPGGGRAPTLTSTDPNADRFARLWDDPFPDVSEISALWPPSGSPSTQASAPSPNPATPTPIVTTPTSPAPRPFTKLLIWNILDARQVPEMKERRLRIRYATVSALLAADYLPARESSLSPLTGDRAPKGKEPIGYFETFRAVPTCKALFQRVILVWTPKEVFNRLDYKMMNDVTQEIEDRDGEPLEGEVYVDVLHHGSSQDLYDYGKSRSPYLDGRISFMRATMAGEFHRFRPIISDDRLIDALFDELSLRIPALNTATQEEKDRPRIVVVIERDTKYSHAIKEGIETKFDCRARLEFCSYLRGLDGRSENAPSAADSVKSENQQTAGDNGKSQGFGETSLGTSQFDYLRRLAVHLGEQTNSRKSRAVSAVGILGSDIYDKMLVLQALQPELPGAIFFTTDLDALYLERANQRYTRNLVVAGLDSLDVNSSLPPMRDSYQTVLAKKVSELIYLSDSQSTTTPYVFEIAPGKPIDLKAGSPASSHTPTRDFVLRQLSYWWMNMIIFCLALVNAFGILAAIFTRNAKKKKSGDLIAPMSQWARTFVYTEVILAIGGIVCLLFFLGWRKETLLLGEPLALGISIWPSVMIRLLAFLVAILLLLIASYSFFSRGLELKETLNAALPEGEYRLPQGMAAETWRLCRSLVDERPAKCPKKTFAFHLDRFFGKAGQPLCGNHRLWRIMGLSTAYFALSALLFQVWPPTVPGRGAFALLDEKIVLALGVSLYIIHLIFCLDLHIGAFNFLRALHAVPAPEVWTAMDKHHAHEKARHMLHATSAFTSIIGRTLLYPLTVLILIILSRLRQFDNWAMTPSLTITFSLGALALVTASLVLWLAGSRLKKQVLARHAATGGNAEELEAINDGVFAAWYNQPIFAAIFSAAAVFGSVSIAGPITRAFFG